MKNYARSLRAFFRFAEDRGWCTPGIAAGIKPPRIYPDEQLPTRLSRINIQRLLATAEGDRPVDKRNRAILMLFIVYGVYGLRALQGDVPVDVEKLR